MKQINVLRMILSSGLSIPLTLGLSVGLTLGCSSRFSPKPIGTAVSSPVALAVHNSGTHFYVLNGNFSHVYDDGSILVIDSSGNKIRGISTPRVGQFLSSTESGNYLMAGFSPDPETAAKAQIRLYDISAPEIPTLVKTFEIDCTPINGIERGSYLAVSCLEGSIYVGKLSGANSTLTKVRTPDGLARRAMHIDTTRNLLFAFVTDLREATYQDRKLKDENSYSITYEPTPTANEVPDDYEKSKAILEQGSSLRNQYKFLIYDLASEEAKGFPEKTNKDSDANLEMRYLYFDVLKTGNIGPAAGEKYYRTNFWAAKPDPTNGNVFYLSHRGHPDPTISPDAAGIVKVTISGDPRSQTGVAPKTPENFAFEGFYGYQAEKESRAYPADFVFQNIAGTPQLIFNDYRDQIYFTTNYYRIASASVFGTSSAEPTANKKIEKTTASNALLGVAVNAAGKALTASFFADTLIMLDISSSGDITESKRIQ